MFWHLYHYRIKTLLRDKSLLFWTLVFPIILGFLFVLAFGGIDQQGVLEQTKVGIVSENPDTSKQFEEILGEIKDGEKVIFEGKHLSHKQAKKQLNTNKLAGYYVFDEDKITLYVNSRDIHQSVLQEILNQYEQNTNLMSQLIVSGELNPESINEDTFVQQNLIEEKKTSNSFSFKSFLIFTLIGMAVMYGYMWGLSNANDQQANQSAKGIRLSLVPMKKIFIATANLLASFSIFFIEILIILGVFYWGFKVEFGEHWGLILLVCAIGSLAAISFGSLIGNLLSNFNLNQKTGIGVSITMAMSFLAGMMGTHTIKYWIDVNLPLLSRLNFVNLISESLYQLFYYQTLTPFYYNLAWLCGYALIFMLASAYFERRIQYASL